MCHQTTGLDLNLALFKAEASRMYWKLELPTGIISTLLNLNCFLLDLYIAFLRNLGAAL
jgi:hypothetical protein